MSDPAAVAQLERQREAIHRLAPAVRDLQDEGVICGWRNDPGRPAAVRGGPLNGMIELTLDWKDLGVTAIWFAEAMRR